jgi:hypothetical protein
MILELLSGSLLVADFVYHRWFQDHPKDFSNFADSIDVPQTEEGTAIPHVYGKVRVTRPILAWMGTPEAIPGIGTLAGKTNYAASMFFVLGAPFAGGDSENHLHRLWQGDTLYSATTATKLSDLDGDGEFEDDNRRLAMVFFTATTSDGDITASSAGAVEFLNGKPTQVMANDGSPYTVHTRAGYRMSVAGVDRGEIPGYRGVLSMCLYGVAEHHGTDNFRWGLTPQLGAISAEVSSYKTDGGYPGVGIYGRIGEDSNPMNVFYDIFVHKLGLPPSLLDLDSLSIAATICYQEDLGFSCCFDSRMPARDMLKELMRHVDGVYFEDRKTGKVKVRLIRPDYDYRSLRHITRANCRKLENLAIGGLTDVPNKIDVVYKDRSRGYIDATMSAQNPANAAGQDGIERVEQRAYRGCTYAAQASALAARDLAFLSRSIIKCRALVLGEFGDIEPGEALRVTWTKPDIDLVFRVAGPPYFGKLGDGTIALDLIQDSQYQYRAFPPLPPIDHPDIGRGIVRGLGTR